MTTRDDGPLRSVRRSSRELRAEVDEEIHFHLAMRIAELRRRGHDDETARRLALQRFGDLSETTADCVRTDIHRERSMHRRAYVSEFRQDIMYALRFLARRPGFALSAIATLAIGIGSATAIVSAADHVLLRPLPYRDADRVFAVWEHDLESGETRQEVSPGNFVAWRDGVRGAEAFGLAEPSGFDLTMPGQPPEPIRAWRVTTGFIDALGVTPAIGRAFTPDEYLPNAAPAVLLSHEFWNTRFAADPGIVGESISIDGVPTIVAGVLQRDADYPGRLDMWAPKALRPAEEQARTSRYMYAVARLHDGVSEAAFAREVQAVATDLAARYPETNRLTSATVVPIEEQVLGAVRPALGVLVAAVLCILFIACANVAGLLLARGAAREHELGVRTALGAGRRRLTRQLLAESLLLALLGGVAGIALAWAGVRWLGALVPPELPRFDSIAVDGRVLLFALALTLASALMFGAAPSLRLARVNALGALRLGARATGTGPHRPRFRRMLVSAEIAIALVLLIGTGLLARSFVALRSTDVGFAVENRAAVQLYLWDRNPTDAQRMQRTAELMKRFAALPGVQEVAVTTTLPFHPYRADIELAVQIEALARSSGQPFEAHASSVSPDYFRLMGIPLTRGRAFDETDRMGAPGVIVVNEAFVRSALGGEDPIGRRLVLGGEQPAISREIVGVVGDVRPTTLESDPNAEVYAPYAQVGSGSVTFVVRTVSEAAAVIPRLRDAVFQVDAGQSVYHAATLESLVADTVADRRFYLTLLAAFSAVALTLTVIGIYGVVSFTTSQRAHEIGVRMALGARRASIVRLVVRDGLRMGVPGVIAGVLMALLLTRFMAHMLYGVTPTDPTTFGMLVVLAFLASAAGTYIPARRAAAQDPARVLRGD